MSLLAPLIARYARIAVACAVTLFANASMAQESLHVYGPGGPGPAMQEAAATYEKLSGVKMVVTAAPPGKWLDQAKSDADLVFSGSENMMTDLVAALGEQLSQQTVTPLYLRPYAILVRPGNPKQIKGVKDLLKPGLSVLVINGGGQTGVWEDMAGRAGDIQSVMALRSNIVSYAKNSVEARQIWNEQPRIDVWLVWNIWQVANPHIADLVPIESDYAIYRDCAIVITARAQGKPAAQDFVRFLLSPDGAAIFAKWGWKTTH